MATCIALVRARITNTPGASAGKLTGKTMAVKDNVALSGVPMTIGSQFMMGCVSAYHATVVRRVLDEGNIDNELQIAATDNCER